MANIILKNGKVFDGEKFFFSDLVIEDGKILRVGKIEHVDGAVVIDCANCIVCSSLTDIHAHFTVIGDKRFGFNAEMATLPFGVTCAVDACGINADHNYMNNLAVDTFVFVPLCFSGGKPDFERAESLLMEFNDRAIGIKVFFDCIENPDIRLEHLERALLFAKEQGKKVMVHTSDSPVSMLDIVKALGDGDILSHAYHGGINTIEENDYSAYKLAKEKGVIIDAGMAGGVHTDFAIVKRAIKKGVIPDTISTDITCASAYMRGGIYGITECMSIFKNLGMKEEEIFNAVTANARKAIGKEIGVIKESATANIAVFKEEESLVDIVDKAGNRVTFEKSYKCKLTIKDGKVLYRG